MHVQVLGLLRFSYPSVYNKRGEDDFEAYRRTLYEPKRLERRLVWFEHVVLPSLANQSDRDFECALLVGDQLPEPYRSRLETMVARVPQIHLCFEEEGKRHRLAIKDLMERYSDPEAAAVAEWQLDDDDAVGRDFVSETRAMWPKLSSLLVPGRWAGLDFCRGLVMQMTAQGHDVRPAVCPFWTPGLVTFRTPGTPTMIRRVSHLDLWKHMPVLSIERSLMYLRGAHEDNASNFSNRWDKYCTDDVLSEVPDVLRQEFGIDLAAMQAARTEVG